MRFARADQLLAKKLTKEKVEEISEVAISNSYWIIHFNEWLESAKKKIKNEEFSKTETVIFKGLNG